MGMDFTAYLAHNLNAGDIYKLCDDLNSESLYYIRDLVKELYEYNKDDMGKPWKVIPDWIGGTTQISGPCGFSVTFSEKVCYFHHYIRWRSFLLDEGIQLSLRRVVFDLAKYFSVSFAIYVPDNAAKESAILDFIWDDENKDIDFIRNWLLEKCGEPKKNIKDIYKEYEEYWDSDGYYIDNFKGLE